MVRNTNNTPVTCNLCGAAAHTVLHKRYFTSSYLRVKYETHTVDDFTFVSFCGWYLCAECETGIKRRKISTIRTRNQDDSDYACNTPAQRKRFFGRWTKTPKRQLKTVGDYGGTFKILKTAAPTPIPPKYNVAKYRAHGAEEYIIGPLRLDHVIAVAKTDRSAGFCVKCGAEHGECEPDTRARKCDKCGAMAVYGAEEIIVRNVS